jgi:hypothetical protein
MIPNVVRNQKFETSVDIPNKLYWYRGDELTLSGSDIEGATNKFKNTVYDLAKVTDGTRPTAVTGTNSRTAMRFTGGSNTLLRGANAPIDDFTFFIVFQANSTSGTQTIIQNQDAATHGFKLRVNAGTIELTVQNSGETFSGVTTTSFAFTDTASPHVLTVKYYRQRIPEQYTAALARASRVSVKLDNVSKIAVLNQRRTLQSTAVTKIGSDSSNNSLSADIYEVIAFSRYVTDAEEQSIYSYLNTYYGISVTTTMPAFLFESIGIDFLSLTGYESAASFSAQVKLYVPNADTPKIILAMAPGYGENYTSYTVTVMRRIANYGLAAMAVNHRGVGNGSGTQDDNGRQACDYADMVTQLRLAQPDFFHQTIAGMYGVSAGGGDALGTFAKIPDFFSVVIDHFGMSDYGYDGTYGWWWENAAFRTNLQTHIGDTPTNLPNEYHARKHLESITNGVGHLYMIHDASDGTVPVDQSDRVKTAMDNASKTNYTFLRSASPDVIRYTHGYPTDAGTTGIATAEPTWSATLLASSEVTIPDTGTIRVTGYWITKKVKIWAGSGTSVENGRNRVFDLIYDIPNNSYNVTPVFDTGATSMNVFITVLSGAHLGKKFNGVLTAQQTVNPL